MIVYVAFLEELCQMLLLTTCFEAFIRLIFLSLTQ